LKPAVIVVMAKEPQAGKTKTRLVPPLTYQEAADLYEALLLDTIEMLYLLDMADLAVAISPPESKAYFQTVTPPGTLLLPIECADIGDCLKQALGELLRLGYHRVIAINADGPTLPSKYLQQALSNLEDHDAVFGEGHDGGYYLVGMKRNHSLLFEDIPWSTNNVLAQTLKRAHKFGLGVAVTPRWYDVDTIQDLKRLKKDLYSLPHDRFLHTRRFLDAFDLPG
jgi:rSAM/selenodomain-associated transferase 1